MNLKNKKVLVVGLGASGLGACRLLLDNGASLYITEKDDNQKNRETVKQMKGAGAVSELGRHTEDFIKGKDLIVLSPGVNPGSDVIEWADKYEIEIVSELELASWFIKCPMICITGTNGKSTVTSLIDHIFKFAGRKTIACGNLGLPLSETVLNSGDLDFAVVEVSSFQLEYIKSFRPNTAVWLNFSYDHLDHHQSMEEYLRAKLRIFENQTRDDWAIVHYTEADRVGRINAQKIIYPHTKNKNFGVGIYGREIDIDLGESQLKGKHNLENIMAAVCTARIYGINDDKIREAVSDFKPLPHRAQFIGDINGVEFYDDSKATNVHAVVSALNSFSGPIVLILGGRDKGDDFTKLRSLIKEKVASLIVIGEAKRKIISQLAETVDIYDINTLEDAVRYGYKIALPGTKIILSPGCSSFDMFKDYKDRGEKFQEAVRKLERFPEIARSFQRLPEVALK